jgi:hypothetical protein
VVFLFGFKEFRLHNQIYVLTILLLYIFGYLFGWGQFGVYNYFHLVSEQVHSDTNCKCKKVYYYFKLGKSRIGIL